MRLLVTETDITISGQLLFVSYSIVGLIAQIILWDHLCSAGMHRTRKDKTRNKIVLSFQPLLNETTQKATAHTDLLLTVVIYYGKNLIHYLFAEMMF